VDHLHYNDRLEHLGLMCLHTRRIGGDLLMHIKLLTVYSVKTYLFFDFDQSGRGSRSKKLLKRRSRLDIRTFAFSDRIVVSK